MKYKEFTEGTFYDKLKQCIKEGYDLPTCRQAKIISKKFDISLSKIVFLYNFQIEKKLENKNFISCYGRLIGVKRE